MRNHICCTVFELFNVKLFTTRSPLKTRQFKIEELLTFLDDFHIIVSTLAQLQQQRRQCILKLISSSDQLKHNGVEEGY